MKKILFICCVASCLLSLGCKQGYNENQNADVSSNGTSEIATNIQDLKNAGLLDNLLSDSRSVSDEDSAAILDFINNTDEVLENIRESDNGDEKLAVINALFNGDNISDFADKFSEINSEKAEELLDYVNTNLQFDTDSNINRSAIDNNRIKLLYATNSNINRTAYASDLEWDTIGWYTSFCVSTIAGFYLLSYGGFWLKIAGAVAATAGTASMVTQLIKWNNCSDLGTFISSLANKDSATANEILNSENGLKILTITTETSATVAACYFTPLGKTIVKTVVYYLNLILGKIITILPAGINFTINGIPIKLITL